MMTRFHSVSFMREGSDPVTHVQIDKVDAAATSAQLVKMFRQWLLSPGESFSAMLPHAQDLSVQLRKIGDTAAVAMWLRGQVLDAVTLLLAGVDRQEDGAAIAMVRGLQAQLPFPPDVFENIKLRQRPLHALLYRDQCSDEDPITAASASLAAVFFSILGTTV